MTIESLRKDWSTLYRTTLPSLAKKRSSVQEKWPVHLDHCFARIILDNAVGEDRPWTQVLKSPAVKNMDEEQLKAAIQMGNDVAHGKVDIVRLDNRSLEFRGKRQKGALVDDASEDKIVKDRVEAKTASRSSATGSKHAERKDRAAKRRMQKAAKA